MTNNLALIIEDDVDLAAIFTTALEASGFRVESISDGKLAHKRLQEITFSLVFIDSHPPIVEHMDLLQQIHNDTAYQNTSTILVTSYHMDPKHLSELPPTTKVLVKPVLFSQLKDLTAPLLVA